MKNKSREPRSGSRAVLRTARVLDQIKQLSESKLVQVVSRKDLVEKYLNHDFELLPPASVVMIDEAYNLESQSGKEFSTETIKMINEYLENRIVEC